MDYNNTFGDSTWIEPVHKIAYVINIAVSLLLTFILIFFKPLRDNKSRKYRLACWALASATFIVGLGGAAVYFDYSSHATVDLFSFTSLLVCFLQAWLFTFLLTLIFCEKYVTRKTVVFHLTPTLVFVLAYLVSLVWWENARVLSFDDWLLHLDNPPLLIRSFGAVLYFVQLGVFTFIFLRERRIYLNDSGNRFDVEDSLELHWVTNSFFFALFIGILAISSCLFPSLIYDTLLTFAITVFYTVITINYANFHYTYGTLYVETAGPFASAQKHVIIRTSERNNNLFDQAEQLMKEEKLYLDPSFNRQELMRLLCTNEKYLSAALSDNSGMTIQAYITSWRVRYAIDELEQSNGAKSIEEIALASGFSSLRSFNRLFRSVTGEIPSKYRRFS